ncbi:polyketide cyclase [Novosphingobium indicum]|jgi:3-phenylpropionate/cinnamic acid dioxygenase small subunit|uniref:Polyketide cyclase n=2 Tax=Novosphingobium indicum TaxID=462949 RepID=A0ABQ2JP13_9SPHN|nr:polyketide cyclase [Novosphingobium indicum]
MRAHGNLIRQMPVSAEDEREICGVLLRYATGIDTRDWPLFRSCFSPDLEADYGTFGTWHGPREIVEYMEGAHRHLGATMHRITNIVIESRNGEVIAHSYVDAILTEATQGGHTHRAAGFYDDTLIRTSDGWKISRRRFTMVKAGLDD